MTDTSHASTNLFETAHKQILQENRISDEQAAIKKIKDECQTTDYEANGCNLDNIIQEFLRKQNFVNLADEMDNVEGWRA